MRSTAPADLIRQDFKMLDARETLRTSWAVEELILLQSILGHAHEGHGAFRGRRFPNTTFDDITDALRLDPPTILHERKALVDEIADWARRACASPSQTMPLTGRNDQPLLTFSPFRYLQAPAIEVLRGLYLGGKRDDPDVRFAVEERTGVRIGGGRCYHVDYQRMVEMDLDADDLARGEWEDSLDDFRRQGLIVENPTARARHIVYQYIRHRKGPGASDDAAIITAGWTWGLGAAIGVFLADAVDTLEKHIPEPADLDGEIADCILEALPALGVGRPEAEQLAMMAVGTVDGTMPDSSLRHLLSIDRKADLCAAEAHLMVVMGVPCPAVELGHERIPSTRLYADLRTRLKGIKR